MNISKFLMSRLVSLLAVVLLLLFVQKIIFPAFESLGGLDNRLLVLCCLFGTLAVSLNLINGITGQFSIGHAAFYLIGAYTTGFITIKYYDKANMNPTLWLVLMVFAGAIASGIVGFVVGLPSLRLRGDYLAVVTLGFGEIVRIIVQNQEVLGGSYGLSIPVKITPLWMVVLLFIFCIAVCRNLLKTAHGLKFLSVREDELAASAMGINTTRTKVTAFVLGAGMAGMAGALFAHYEGFITLKMFGMEQSFIILTMVVIGGTGSITGAAIAGVFFTLLPESLRDLPNVPATALFSFLFAIIIITVLAIRFKKHMKLEIQSVGQKLFSYVGYIGSVFALFVAVTAFIGLIEKLRIEKGLDKWGLPSYMLWSQGFPIVSSMGIVLVCIGMSLTLLFTKRRAPNLAMFGYVLGVIFIAVLLTYPVRSGMESIPFFADLLKDTSYSAANLRFPFFALSLVVVMLSRPQGMFGHHEFSWSWVKSLFGKREPKTAVSA